MNADEQRIFLAQRRSFLGRASLGLGSAALASLLDKGVRTVPFPDDVMAAAATASRDLMDDAAAGDAQTRELLTSYRAFQSASDRWFGLAEWGMAKSKLR